VKSLLLLIFELFNERIKKIQRTLLVLSGMMPALTAAEDPES
jgi:hypothetical protein